MKITIRGWQAISPVFSHPIDDVYFHSPLGSDDSEVQIAKRKLKPPATGWCSWYAFGTNITEGKILSNARWMADHNKLLPLNYVIIDDGYHPWGDWQTADPEKFPRGLKPVASEIKSMGLKPGLWMAPFVAHTNSEIFKKQDWFLKDSKGGLIYGHNAMKIVPDFFWPHAYVLDYEKPEVEKYIHDSIDTMLGDWGFNLIKLDFMASIYFDPHLKTPKIPHHFVKNLLSYIHKNYPHVYILGGVIPIKPILGLADSIRISNDTIIPQLDGVWPINKIVHTMRLTQLGENLIGRKNLAEVIALDPDVFVCRGSLGFSEEQIRWLATIIKETPNGLKILGDDLPNLSWERVQKYILPLFRK